MSAHDLNTIVPCVYFIRSGEFGPIKIGKTNRGAHRRLLMLQGGSPETLHLLATIAEPSEEFEEESLHRRFAHLRIRGEWFESTLELTNFIAEYADPSGPPRGKGRPRVNPVLPSPLELKKWEAIDVFCNQPAVQSPVSARLSSAEKRLMDIMSIRAGQFTAKEIAKIRGVHWQRVYEWVDEVEDQIAAMARETRGPRRAGSEVN